MNHGAIAHHVLLKCMMPSFGKLKVLFKVTDCLCRSKYTIPTMDYYPEQLSDLSNGDQSLLQLFEIDTGLYKVHQYGYREKTAPIVIRKKSTTVEDRIMEVENLDRRRKLDTAFEYLMTCSDSDYWLDFFLNFIYIFITFLYWH